MKPLAYSVAQRTLHWLTALLIFFNLLFPGQIERVTDQLAEGSVPAPQDWTSANLHIYTGFAIIGLTVLRLILRVMHGAPEAPAEEPAFFRLVSKLAHGLIYLLLFAMPIAGIAKFYLGVHFAGFLHGGPMKVALWTLLIAHVCGVLVHKFYWKTNVLDRMTRGVN